MALNKEEALSRASQQLTSLSDEKFPPRKTWDRPLYKFNRRSIPPNTLTNADGTPYSAGYDDATKDAKLQELVFTALGQASMCWSETPKAVFDDAKAKSIGEELIRQIRNLII